MPPRSQRTLSVKRDDKAEWRCANCPHLWYPALGPPGGPCQINAFSKVGCACADHGPQKIPGGDAA